MPSALFPTSFLRRPALLLALLLAPGVGPAWAQLTVTGRTPARHALAAPRPAPIGLTFSQAPDPATAGTVRVFSARRGGQLVRGANAAVAGNTLTVTPAQPLQPGETVLVAVPRQLTSAGPAPVAATAEVYQFTVAAGPGPGSFIPRPANAEVTVGNGPTNLALGDVDGDGDPDLLAAIYLGNSVSLRLNNGAGSFTGATSISVGARPGAVVLGDVDNDGDLDLLTANADANSVSLRLNNGLGVFTAAPAAETSVGRQPTDLALADVDADGDLDLLTANYLDGTVSVRLNGGTGDFTPAPVAEAAVGIGPVSLALGDLDNDGDLDLTAVRFGFDGRVAVRLNNGTGTFAAPAASPELTVGGGARAVALGDLDADGDLDLVTANSGAGTVSVLLNDGGGRFAPPAASSELPTGAGTAGVALGDVDGDGDLDLLAANVGDNNVSVRLNNGTGSFAPPAYNSEPGVGNAPTGVVLADVDADGDLDLLTPNNGATTVSVRLNQLLAPTAVTAAPLDLTSGSATLGGNVANDGGAPITERGVVYVAGPGTPTLANQRVVMGSGTGSFAQRVTGLAASTRYTVRAYATNAVGTSYGSSVGFSTPQALATAPAGAAALQLYPNPARHQLVVRRPAGGAATAELCSTTGQVVRRFALPAPQATLDLRGLPAGAYHLRLALPDGVVVRRVLLD